MAIGNETRKTNINIRSGLSTDIKPTSARDNDEFYEIDTGDTYIWHKTSWVRKITPRDYTLVGIASSGTSTTLVDTTKDFGIDAFMGYTMRITIDNVDYYRHILGTLGDTITFATLGDDIEATLTLGSGEAPEGQVIIRCKGDAIGEIGNDYTLKIVAGLTETGMNYIDLDTDNKLITITVDNNENAEPRQLMAGDVQTLIDNTDGIKDLFEVGLGSFTAGEIPFTDGEVLDFAGGADAIIATNGTSYVIY